ncbi:MAG: AraC family transcriptional regulator [Verrucomicrobia bacterium 61-8]|nr:PocR ligand-binding domain-containing protein [Verrucomicrobiota bacterium]OJU98342.1 MAG: AraC family transcriptional regulator [Verrucomicrobia bacterium 61-8]
MLPSQEVLQKLSRSTIYRDYERAFSEATDLPLALRARDGWKFFLHGKPKENPFCSLLADSSKACAQCLQSQDLICDPTGEESRTVKCFAGLYDTAVPIRVGDKVVGYLQTGQVAMQEPSSGKFKKITEQLIKWGSDVDLGKLHEAYFHSRVLKKTQYESMIRLLEIFAQHLSEVANQLVLIEEEKDPPMVRRARAYINDNHSDPLTLTKLAETLHVSTFYFCKMFKKATGMTFTDYLGRVRIEKAKALLLHADLRISEIAYQVGFQSLTHFNRQFRVLTGVSPTEFRKSAQHV